MFTLIWNWKPTYIKLKLKIALQTYLWNWCLKLTPEIQIYAARNCHMTYSSPVIAAANSLAKKSPTAWPEITHARHQKLIITAPSQLLPPKSGGRRSQFFLTLVGRRRLCRSSINKPKWMSLILSSESPELILGRVLTFRLLRFREAITVI